MVLRSSFWKDPNKKQPILSEEERQAVIRNGHQGNHKTWRYAVAVDMSGLGFSDRNISKIFVQRQLFFPVGDNYFSPLPLVNEGLNGE